MMAYCPLRVRSAYSIQLATNRPWQVALRALQVGATAAAVCDYGSVSGIPAFVKACKDACKNCGYPSDRHAEGGKGPCVVKGASCPGYDKGGVRPILGSDFFVCRAVAADKTEDNRRLSRAAVLAKNLAGWKGLVKATTAANRPEHFDARPRLDLEALASFAGGNWVVLNGSVGSALADTCFLDPEVAYVARNRAAAQQLLKPQKNLKRDLTSLAGKLRELFGRENLVLETGLLDAQNVPAAGLLAAAMRWLSSREGIPIVAAPDAHYPEQDDAADQRVMLANSPDVNLTLDEIATRQAAGENVAHGHFFRSRNYHLPSGQEMIDAGHAPQELTTSLLVAERCEAFDIFSRPMMPAFDCPGGKSPSEYLKELCRDGWRRKVQGKVPKEKHGAYGDRVKKELEVFSRANLESYFLVTHDFNQHAQRALKCKKSRGRGSAAGCLVSYLLDITECDPIRYDLSFERFYNDARNDPATGRVAMPDIDCDFPSDKRDAVIDYIRQKYGADRVAQLATFTELRGRDALTAVLRAHGWGTFEERKQVTAAIPDPAKISDDLQEMLEEDGQASICGWALENNEEQLKAWVTVEKDGSITGQLARHFEQAIRLEGVKKAQGRHPSALVITPGPVTDIAPLVHDKSSEHPSIGWDMHSAEPMGLIKWDCLAVSVLSKIQTACEFAKYGRASGPRSE